MLLVNSFLDFLYHLLILLLKSVIIICKRYDKIMNRLKELRKQKKLTQQGLADEISVSKITILRWENGERQIKEEKAQQLADYFGVSIDICWGIVNIPIKI